MNDNYNSFFWLNVISNIAQLESYNILLHDFNNNDLMEYLKHQDDLLSKLINQNERIIELLEGGKENARSKKNDTKNS